MNNFEDSRPNPDELLESLMLNEELSKRGNLKIFFGMCAGVGKTYTMLQTARTEKFKGADIVIGYIETHDRHETAELLQGLELLPRKTIEYKSALLDELDLDAIIARKPQIVIVDELAHTNVPGSRHTKRYQDVMEILENGIHVFTTLNVQHLESKSETVSQITGIIVHETLPDEVFENAYEVELVDLSPDKLLQRLAEGKVYTPERSQEAIENFFRIGNITALRQMALRIVADRVDKQLHDYMQHKRIRGPWKSGLHLLVGIGLSPYAGKLLRWAKSLSYSMGAGIQAVYVETLHKLTEKEQAQLEKNISLAKVLGIKVRIITNKDVVKAIVDFAQKENVTHIIVGKPQRRNILSLLKLGNYINRLIRYSGNIDIYILGSDSQVKDPFLKKASLPSFTSTISHYLIASLCVVFPSIIFFLLKDIIGYQIVSFGLLLTVSVLAIFYGTGPIILASTLSALIWDFLFIPPPYTLHIEKPVDMLMLLMFFIIALLSGILTSRVRRQEKKIRVREGRTHALYQLTLELNMSAGLDEVTKIAIKYIRKQFNLNCAILLKDESNKLETNVLDETKIILSENEMSVASWVFKHSVKAGKYTDTLPSGDYTIYPLKGNSGNMGVIVVEHENVFSPGEDQFWEASVSQISGKYEREFLRNAAKNAYLLNESDKLYKTLFNSISHELRIPIATVMGASDTLLSQYYPEEIKVKLYSEIHTAAIRLNRLIDNLLNMSRLESGHITLNPNWCDVHDIANKVADSLKPELQNFNFLTVIPADMPLVLLDFGLIEQVIYNLVLNATQNASGGTNIRLKFFYDLNSLTIQVMDRGKGFPASELSSVFNKFYRGKNAMAGGTGLGLSIAKGFVEAHQGTIAAANRQNGGAVFTIKIPVKISVIDSNYKLNE